MRLQEWWFWYDKIVKTLKLDREKDQESTFLLSKLIVGKALTPNVLRAKIHGKNVLVFGAGPSLEEDLWNVIETGFYGKCTLVTADGATSALLERGIVPHVVVTDLDGKIPDLVKAQKQGSVLVVHAHGDNIETLKRIVPKLNKILGTTQVKPVPRVYNFGGFTDGDRCVFLAENFDAKKIILAGMDFGNMVGKYSKPNVGKDLEISPFKRKKLQIAKRLLEWLSSWAKVEILNLTSHGENIRGIKKVGYKQLVKL